ncbi:MAG: biotin--[Clostridia bacterium]|nr:biotin--[acetyl-CoA-carboxylase] ligase [Clostridia bacterium]
MRKLFWVKGVKVYAYDRIDSTNNEAKRRIAKGQELPLLLVAKKQTAGKGTRGRSFHSSGGGLYMSLAVKTDETRLQKLTVLAAVATAQAIEKLSGVQVGIKWVNDIYLNGKKLCGILTERVADPNTNQTLGVVIGIGVNLFVKEFPEDIKNIAISLNKKGVTAKKLSTEITKRILSLLNGNQDFMQYYKEKSVLLGKQVSYLQYGNQYTATAVDIDENGALIVEDENKNTTILKGGDVTLLK